MVTNVIQVRIVLQPITIDTADLEDTFLKGVQRLPGFAEHGVEAGLIVKNNGIARFFFALRFSSIAQLPYFHPAARVQVITGSKHDCHPG